MTLVKSHAKIPPKVCRSAGFGPSGPNSVCFGSNLDMLSLHSNKHQNLWNSLVIIVMAWLGPTFHEIRRSVGGENHHYQPPTHTPLHLSRSASRQVPSPKVSLAPNTMEKHLSVEIGSTKHSYASALCTQRVLIHLRVQLTPQGPWGTTGKGDFTQNLVDCCIN